MGTNGYKFENHRFPNMLKPGNTLILSYSKGSEFKAPSEFTIKCFRIIESGDPYHPFDQYVLTDEHGFEVFYDTFSKDFLNDDFIVYKTYKEWYVKELDKIQRFENECKIKSEYALASRKCLENMVEKYPDQLI